MIECVVCDYEIIYEWIIFGESFYFGLIVVILV